MSKNTHNNDTSIFAQMLSILGVSVEKVNIEYNGATIDTAYIIIDTRTERYIVDDNDNPILYHTAKNIAIALKDKIEQQFADKLTRAIIDNGFAIDLWKYSQNRAVTYDTLIRIGEYCASSKCSSQTERDKRNRFYNRHKLSFQIFNMLVDDCTKVDLVNINDFVLSRNISALNLSTRINNGLYRYGIATIGQLINTTKEELLSIRNLGEAAVKEILDALEDNDLTLGML